MYTTGYPKKSVCVSFQGRCFAFEVRLFQHGVLFSFGGWLVVKEIGVRGWWTQAEVISQLRLIGPGCWSGAKHGRNRRFSFLSCREPRYSSCACESGNLNFRLLLNKSGDEFQSSVLSFSLSIVRILGICKRLQTIEVKFKNWEFLVKARTFSSSKN